MKTPRGVGAGERAEAAERVQNAKTMIARERLASGPVGKSTGASLLPSTLSARTEAAMEASYSSRAQKRGNSAGASAAGRGPGGAPLLQQGDAKVHAAAAGPAAGGNLYDMLQSLLGPK
jgi:hypothetical protein